MTIPRQFAEHSGAGKEYAHRVSLVNKAARKLVTKVLGWTGALTIFLDGFSTVGYRRDRFYKEILENSDVKDDSESTFIIYIKLAESAGRNQSYELELDYLKKAVAIKRSDVVANYRLGLSFEAMGQGAEAIAAYTAAQDDPLIDHNHLGQFIRLQVERVQADGPRQRGSCEGLSRMSW